MQKVKNTKCHFNRSLEYSKLQNSQFLKGADSKNIGLVSYKGINTKLEGYPTNFKEKLAKIDFKWASDNRERLLKKWETRYGKGE